MKTFKATVTIKAHTREIAEGMMEHTIGGADDYPLAVEGVDWTDGQGLCLVFTLEEVV